MKICTKCKLPKTEFYADKRRSDGLRSQCKDCTDTARETKRQQTLVNDLEVKRQYIRTMRMNQTEEEHEAARAANRQWYHDNPDWNVTKINRRRSLLLDQFVENVHPLILLELHDGVCGICNEDVDPFDFHVDHRISLFKGGEHSYANTQPAHPICNIRKGTN